MSNKRQMDKFFKNIDKAVKDKAKDASLNRTYEVKCPKCESKRKMFFRNGKGKCPKCKSVINLDLNWVRNS